MQHLKKVIVFILIIISCSLQNVKGQDTVYASHDTYIDKSSDTGLGIDPLIVVRRWTSSLIMRGLIRFPSSQLPDSGSTIISARLELYVVAAVGISSILAVHKIQQSPARNWDVNSKWSKYNGNSNWTTSGGDFEATATDTYTMDNVIDAGTYISLDVTSDVQNFVNDTTKNFGWILKHNDESGTDQATWYFGSLQEITLGEARPRLIINSTPLLPISLLNFNVIPQVDLVKLNWTTLSETNNDFFSVERSIDAINWEIIGQIEGAGNSNTRTNYDYKDTHPFSGVSYYRLKQTDFNGNYEYSQVKGITIRKSKSEILSLYPNPTTNQFKIKGNEYELNDIEIYNGSGANVTARTTIFTDSEGLKTISLIKLPKGIYCVKTKTNLKTIYKQ